MSREKIISLYAILVFVCMSMLSRELYANSVIERSQQTESNQSVQNWGRDPFTPSSLMYERVGVQDGKVNRIFGFIPSSENTNIPTMKLRGLINNNEDEFIALLEVKGAGVFMVREGDEFNIDPSQPKNAIRISKITRLSVTVETGRLGSIRVLR